MSPAHYLFSESKDFYVWSAILQGDLHECDCFEYVFDDDFEPAVVLPVQGPEESREDFISRARDMLKKDRLACDLILGQVDGKVRRVCYSEDMSAKQLYESIERIYKPRYNIHTTTRALQKIRLTKNNTFQYCVDFQGALTQHARAVEQYAKKHKCDEAQIEMPPFYINILFQQGTSHVPWLQNWRNSRRPHIDTLGDMITSLRHETPPWELP